jgi:hypothetical protein
MPNHDLVGKTFKVPEKFKDELNGNSTMTYSNMKKVKSELDNKQEKTASDHDLLRWISTELKQAANTVDAPKRVRKESGTTGKKEGGNNYKKTHSKDRKNKNPTAIGGLPDVRTMAKPENIANNTVDYVKESTRIEMDKIMYLIEYMNNDKPKIK